MRTPRTLPTSVRSHTDTTRRRGAASFEAMERRQLCAILGPDLQPVSLSMTPTRPLAASGEVTVDFTIRNSGTFIGGDAGAFDVTFWSGRDDPRTRDSFSYAREHDVRVAGIRNGKTYSGSVTFNLSRLGDFEDNEAFLYMQIDTAGERDETNESNNWCQGYGVDFVRYLAEGDLYENPTVTTPVLGHALGVNGVLRGEIGDEAAGSRDLDIFHVNLTPERRYLVDVDRLTGSLDSYVRVYSPGWNLIASNDNGRDENEAATTDSYVEFMAGQYGEFHIVVSAKGNHYGDPRTMNDRFYQANNATGAYYVSLHELHTPVVNLQLLDGSLIEGGSDNGVVRVSRTGSPDSPLHVNWTLDGSAQLGADFTFANSNADGSGITVPAGMQSIDVVLSGGNEHVFEAQESIGIRLAGGSGYGVGINGAAALILHNSPDDKPRVINHGAIFSDNNGPRVKFAFDQDISSSLDAGDFVLLNQSNGQVVEKSKYTYAWNASSREVTVRFSGYANGVLPDGDYRLTALATGIRNVNGVSMAADASVSFFTLAGDVNRDRTVNFDDLLRVAQNYGRPGGATPGEGNVNFDAAGTVDFDDLLVLAQNYGKTLRVPLTAAVTSPGSTPTFGTAPIAPPARATARTRQLASVVG